MTTQARLADPLWSRVTSGDLDAVSCRLAQTRLRTEAYILAIKLHYWIRDTSLGWDTFAKLVMVQELESPGRGRREREGRRALVLCR